MLVLDADGITGVVVRMGTERNRQHQSSQGQRCAEKAEHELGQHTFRPYRFTGGLAVHRAGDFRLRGSAGMMRPLAVAVCACLCCVLLQPAC